MMVAILTMVAVWCLLSVVAATAWATFRAWGKDELSPCWLWAVPVLFSVGVLLDMLLR